MSEKGVLIHLDDDKTKLVEVKRLFGKTGIDLEMISCETKDEFDDAIEKNHYRLRAIIFDLFGIGASKGKLSKEEAEFLESIRETFNNIGIPIFIYSGHLLDEIIEDFKGHGTVFIIDKTDGPDEIFVKLKLFQDSGFLEVFCPGGKLDRELHSELINSFIQQFTSNDQIEKIISTIDVESPKEKKDRVERVFTRIAVRSLMTGLSNLESEVDDFNPVEHYLKRIDKQPVSTGDIFKNKEEEEYILIITPRCDLANQKNDNVLVCEIDVNNFPEGTISSKQKEKIKYALTDNPKYSGYDRYLVRSPFFVGGIIKISSYKMIIKEDLLSHYSLHISLSDELTNEILGKFGSYFFRTGITDWSLEESIKYIDSIKEED